MAQLVNPRRRRRRRTAANGTGQPWRPCLCPPTTRSQTSVDREWGKGETAVATRDGKERETKAATRDREE
ncbi:hypothetical protein E2562_035677 [Oryza meyeriana var. granulata]|uniref:Uncharacterized protein n=1 Tax=Oryza meyeriana var. granulata TaxID=110450 RepID=A0A6G1CWU7_9ORYZ|nr:hypothetical protein E2562_035677 [Oryza meyeriana var. granulata]KAF0904570.1 hypothetical protein E2562_035677 [Oryza meyeriana var. granulata]KAF0904571.1 hypothetical protein E2562_035677 [Oryza meyeriana var. granulata]